MVQSGHFVFIHRSKHVEGINLSDVRFVQQRQSGSADERHYVLGTFRDGSNVLFLFQMTTPSQFAERWGSISRALTFQVDK